MSQVGTNAAPEAPAAVPRRVVVPPESYDRFRIWSSFFIAVIVCLPPLFIELGRPDVVSDHEATVLLKSRETWEKLRSGVTLAWLIPAANGQPAIDPPPMTVWLHIAAWADLDPATVTPDMLIWRARLATVLMAILTLGATYWAGMSIGGVRVARIATMALGTMLLFMHEARFAGAEVVLLGWTTLAIAAGLWAMRPLKPINWVGRRVIGWFISGLAMGGSVMTTGPVAMLFILPPMLAATLLTRYRRLDNALGLLFAVILGTIAVSPWYLYVVEQVPGAWEQFVEQFSAPRDLFLLTWSHGRAVALMSPWQVWIAGALCQPFLRADADARRQLLIAWSWFVLLFVLFSIPAARHPRYLVPILPAAALMVGQLWGFHAQLASERQEDPGVNLLRVPHWLLIGIASIAGPTLLALQPYLLEHGHIDEMELPGLTWHAWAALGSGLLLIALLGTRWHFKWRPRLAAYATVAWMLVATTVCFYAFTRSHHNINEYKFDARRLAETTRGHELVYLYQGPADLPPDPRFLFYLGRAVRPVTPEHLDELRTTGEATYVMTRGNKTAHELLAGNGFVPVMRFDEPEVRDRQLYRVRGTDVSSSE